MDCFAGGGGVTQGTAGTNARRARRSPVFGAWLAIRSRRRVAFAARHGEVTHTHRSQNWEGLRPAVSVTQRNHDPDQDGCSTAAQGIRTVSGSTRFLGWTLRGWVAALVCAVGHRDPNPAAACCSVIWSMSPMKRCLAAFAIAASLFEPVAHANDALEAKVRAYVPVVSLVKVCDIRINEATSGDHRAMVEAVKSDPNANKLAYRLHYETQTAYIKT